LLRKDAGPWTEQHTEAVQKIKKKVQTLKTLSPINEESKKVVFTDASGEGWGGILCQIEDNKLQICKYVSGIW